MRPLRIFLFGISVIIFLSVILAIIQYFDPVIFGYKIKYLSFSELIKPSKPKYKDISHIISLSASITDSTVASIKSDSVKEIPLVSSSNSHKSNIKTDSLRMLYHKIEFPKNLDTLLFPFFDEISSLGNTKKLIRILHYGDSQIEGDRITSYIRNQLQARFGGSGIGLFPIVSANPASISYVYEISDNWKKFSPLQGAMEDNDHRYGVLVNYAKINLSGSFLGKGKELSGWVDLKYPNISYPLAQQSERFRIFYGYNKTPMMVELTQGKSVIDAEIVPPSNSIQELKWTMPSPRNIHVSFKSVNSPEIYGLSLDAGTGIAVDNIPLRGSSGLEFNKVDNVFLGNFYRLLNVKLIILQFGVNVVPTLANNYDYYEKSFYKQLIAIKRTMPNLPVLVIGVSDMSRNSENGYESYPNIEKIRDAQKKATFEAGCAFWDIFEAMGGRNSMPSWVFANPPLAQKDFVHFNPVGAKIIGEMFYRSFIFEYGRYLTARQKVTKVAMLDK